MNSDKIKKAVEALMRLADTARALSVAAHTAAQAINDIAEAFEQPTKETQK